MEELYSLLLPDWYKPWTYYLEWAFIQSWVSVKEE